MEEALLVTDLIPLLVLIVGVVALVVLTPAPKDKRCVACGNPSRRLVCNDCRAEVDNQWR